MKKKLDTTSITNDLRGASVFFKREPLPLSPPPLMTIEENPDTKPQEPSVSQPDNEENKPTTETIFAANKLPAVEVIQPPSSPQLPKPPREQEPKPTDDTVIPRHHDTVVSQPQALVLPANEKTLEAIRTAVKQLGKEAATHRFTQEEKQAVAEIVFDYKNRHVRTSENEIARIAINLLIIDHKTNGAKSLLAKVLDKLNG